MVDVENDDDLADETEWKEENRMTAEDWDNENIQDDEWGKNEPEEGWRETPQDKVEVDSYTPDDGGGGEEPIVPSAELQYEERFSARRREFPQDYDTSPGETHLLNVGFGQYLRKMPREAWGSLRPMPRLNLVTPVSRVRFTHTGTQACTTTEECMDTCRQIQKYYMDLGFPDIPYNFLVGGDGIVYHARGWQKQADRPLNYNNLRKNCIDVAYIGNYESEKVPFSLLSIGADFIKYGLKIGKITPFYQVYSFLGEKHV